MKVDCELTPEEKTAVSLALGMATGANMMHPGGAEMAKATVSAMNKLFALSPDYTPYDVNSFDPDTTGFPFRRITPQ